MSGPPLDSMSFSTVSSKSLRVVAIGGGTGLSTLLRGLKRYVAAPKVAQPLGLVGRDLASRGQLTSGPRIRDLSAIVTVTDDGGSSGRLREDLNILPSSAAASFLPKAFTNLS